MPSTIIEKRLTFTAAEILDAGMTSTSEIRLSTPVSAKPVVTVTTTESSK